MSKVEKVILGMQATGWPSDYWIVPDREFPELEASRTIMQRNGQSVWEHTMSVIDLITPKKPTTLLSGLFHDLGKCFVQPMGNPFLSKFPGHAIASADIAETKLTEWGAAPDLIDRVIRLITMHMYDISNVAKEKTIRKFVAEVGPTNIDDWFALRIADSRSYAAQQQYHNHYIEPFRTLIMSYITQQPGANQPTFAIPDKTGSIQIKGGEAS